MQDPPEEASLSRARASSGRVRKRNTLPKAETSLRCDASGPASARQFVADVLWSRGFGIGCIERAVLLTSEAVTNAVIHARSDVRLVVTPDNPMARVEVFDADPSPPVARPPQLDGAGGLGIHVIDAIAEDWGVQQCGGAGKCVWFEVR